MKKMIDDIYIRDARTGDIPEMVSLLRDLFSIEADFTPDRRAQQCALQMILKRPNDICCKVAVHVQGVVGMCTGHLQISTAEGGYALRIEDLIVARDYRRKGIGKALLDSVCNWSRAAGATRAQLLADSMNQPALQFYQAHHWIQTQLSCLHKRLSSVKRSGSDATRSHASQQEAQHAA